MFAIAVMINFNMFQFVTTLTALVRYVLAWACGILSAVSQQLFQTFSLDKVIRLRL